MFLSNTYFFGRILGWLKILTFLAPCVCVFSHKASSLCWLSSRSPPWFGRKYSLSVVMIDDGISGAGIYDWEHITNVIIMRHLGTCEVRSCGWGSCSYWSAVSFSHYCTPLDALSQKGFFFISSLRPLFKKLGFVVCFRKKSYTGNCPPVNVVRHNNSIPKVAADLGLPQL